MDKKKLGALNSLISLVVVIVLLIMINILGNKYHFKIDLTQNKIYSLSKASINLVKKINDNLIVKCFFSSNLPENYEINRKYLKDLLEEYNSYSNGKIKFEFIDPDTSSEWKNKLQALGIPKVQITGISQDKFEVKNIYMGVVFYYQDKKEVLPVLKNIKNLEYNISKIIKKLTSKKIPIIGLLGAGGTAVPEVELTKISQSLRSYMDVETVRLVKYLDIQDAVDALVIVDPRIEIPEWTLYQIDQFIMKGKPVIFLIDMTNTNFTLMRASKNTTNINKLLEKYGVKVSAALIADIKNQRIAIERKVNNFLITNTINYPFYPVFTDINKKYPFLTDFDALYFPLINKIDIISKDNKTPVNIDYLFKSSTKSYLEKEPYLIDPYQQFKLTQFNSGQQYIGGVLIKGKLNSAYQGLDLNILKDKTLEKKEKKEKYEIFNLEKIRKKFKPQTNNAKVIVIGDSDFIKNPLIDKTMESFFMNMLDWCTDNSGLINIRSKGIKLRLLKDTTESKKLFVKIFNIILIPVLLVLLGIFIRKIRRKNS
jgi:gliding-associated putative ABC transporter substrate-binding component GldG